MMPQFGASLTRVRVKQRIRSPFFECLFRRISVLRVTSRRGGCYTLAEHYGECIHCFTPAPLTIVNYAPRAINHTPYIFMIHATAKIFLEKHSSLFCQLQFFNKIDPRKRTFCQSIHKIIARTCSQTLMLNSGSSDMTCTLTYKTFL